MTQRSRAGRFKKRRQTAASTTTDRGQGTAPTQQFQVDPDLKTARAIAYETLRAVEERPVFIKTVLDELCRSYDVAGRERALAYEIAAGVTRRRTTLDVVIDARLRNPTERIESRLRTVLRIGAYQLLLLATATARSRLRNGRTRTSPATTMDAHRQRRAARRPPRSG